MCLFLTKKKQKMKARNFVQYDFFKIKNFMFFEFNAYKGLDGKRVEYKDINGDVQPLRFTSPTVLLDMDNEGHVLIDNFLKNYPAVRAGQWKRTDIGRQEQEKTKATLDSARAIIEAAKMTDKEVKQYSTMRRFNLNSDTDVLRARIIEDAQENADVFMETHFDPEKDLRVFIIEAVRERKINYENDTFYYGREAIGTNEEQVLVWLKDNKDILAILKHEIRGESKPKTKTVKIED